ncbi:MAG TPA: TetR/AcrR family transcriptional regulator [Inquilinus sp.]|nr:TetR/AcrR family transcriptional regulator [Inquilinus sp.]
MSKPKTVGTPEDEASPLRARDRIFAAADDLFYRHGIRAVGVDAIVKEAGVAKISLYRSFPSKDDLVVAYLADRNADYWRRWDLAFAKHEGDPRAQLRAMMEHLADRTTAPDYRGCPFTNDATEFPEPSHPGRQVAEANKRELRLRLLRLAEALGAPEPKVLADSLVLLVEGAYAISQTLGGRDGPGKAIAWAAEALVEAQLGQGGAKVG